MIKLEQNTFCYYSNIAFLHLIADLNSDGIRSSEEALVNILFVDGDVTFHLPSVKSCQSICFVVALVKSDSHYYRALAFSDLVVSSKLSYDELKFRVATLIRRGKTHCVRHCNRLESDNLKEGAVLDFLFKGYSIKQTAKEMNLSYKAISRYKRLAVKNSGFKNFNVLMINMVKNKIFLNNKSEI
ncbi:hypothetical protein I5495_25455 [Citrobacter amalonaticus]|uniref:hypothetical protein n=1 Tax=Citrobacter amalonaticus TaxID=35703 RepID=UPI00190580D4|nr:hypothetical protein [Citrobacter amalonaticus]MBJ9260677.1 hypothetical protein [Citrobacter amalonaticus]